MKKHFKIFLFAFLFLGISAHAFGQEEIDSSFIELKEFVQKNDSIEKSNIEFHSCYIPEFRGGEKALLKFFKDNLVYPDSALKNNIEGKVYVGFLVEKDGSISDVKIVSKNIYGYGLEEEALRVVRMMPKWTNEDAQKIHFSIPISFKIPKELNKSNTSK